MIDRRRLLFGLGALSLLGVRRVAAAKASGDARLVVILLRGGLDGLAAVPPVGDPAYAAARGALALPSDRVTQLDATFGLHPGLAALIPLWQRGEILPVQAVGLAYRGRSHFEAQDLLENGSDTPHGAPDGWLARALVRRPDAQPDDALALARTAPLLLRSEAAVATYDPRGGAGPSERLLNEVEALWEGDPVLEPALVKAMDLREQLDEDAPMASGGGKTGATQRALGVLGALLAKDDGPRVAAVELGGWDSHQSEGGLEGPLANRLTGLGEGLAGLASALAPVWRRTVVLAISEFGRTVAPNGTKGTDHGTGGLALLAGGAVAGGRIAGDWPGLAPEQRFEGRDLRTTTDARALFKGVLRDHLGLDRADLDRLVFPGSGNVKPLDGLIRS